MNDRTDNKTLEQLRERYQQVTAPPELAGRIRKDATELAQRRAPRWLLPFAGGVAAAAALIVAMPLVMNETSPSIPTMTELASAMPDKPAVTMPSVSSFRLPQRPPLPERPRPERDPATSVPNEDTGATVQPTLHSKEKNV